MYTKVSRVCGSEFYYMMFVKIRQVINKDVFYFQAVRKRSIYTEGYMSKGDRSMANEKQVISWYKIALTLSERISGKERRIENEFQSLYMKLNRPNDISLFCSDKPLSESMIYYVSTDDNNIFHTKLIQRFVKKQQGVPCEEPKKDFVSPLISNKPWYLFTIE